MGLMDVLRKLGVVQSGTVTATYTSGKDRPIEFQHDDLSHPVTRSKPGPGKEGDDKTKDGSGGSR